MEGRKINYRHAAMRSSSYVQKLIMLRPEIAYTFGNPQFEGLGVYTQDHLQTFGEALQRGKYDPQKLINGYVDLILLHWQYGIAERTFNCTVNNGVDTLGRVMLLDFGEITTSQQKAAAQIKTQRWQRAWSFNSGDIPTKLQEYYHRVLQTRLSLEALKVAWRVKR